MLLFYIFQFVKLERGFLLRVLNPAENRALISQLQSYNVAANTFKVKYNCTAGDCANATAYFPGTTNGDGNGVVSSMVALPSYASMDLTTAGFGWTLVGIGENSGFWNQLTSANLFSDKMKRLIDGQLPSVSFYLPETKNGDATSIIILGMGGANYFNPGINAFGGFLANPSTNFSPADAAYVYEKMDGNRITTTNAAPYGLGSQRIIISSSNSGGANFYAFQSQGAGGATSDVCINTSVTPAYFNVTNPKKLCGLIIKADF